MSINSSKGSRKFKTVPGFLKYKIAEVKPEELIPNCFTPFLVPVKVSSLFFFLLSTSSFFRSKRQFIFPSPSQQRANPNW